MDGQELRLKGRRGEILYGTMWAYPNPAQVAQVSSSDLDFIVIDTEHTPNDRATVRDLAVRIAAAGIAPLVRVPGPDPNAIRQALDAGAHGVVVPYCEEPEVVRRCLAAARYRPLKERRLEEAIAAGGPPDPATRAYLEHYNRHSFFVAMIESAPAIERLEAILAVGGIDAVFIGPHDLTVSLDVPEQYEHPLVQEGIATIIHACAARGIPAGTQWWSPELVRRELALGARFVLYSNDLNMIRDGYRTSMAAIRGYAAEMGMDSPRG
jgi:2-keto-3-deoxy-L-rhamnonate aldolase RhmA